MELGKMRLPASICTREHARVTRPQQNTRYRLSTQPSPDENSQPAQLHAGDTALSARAHRCPDRGTSHGLITRDSQQEPPQPGTSAARPTASSSIPPHPPLLLGPEAPPQQATNSQSGELRPAEICLELEAPIRSPLLSTGPSSQSRKTTSHAHDEFVCVGHRLDQRRGSVGG